MSREGRGAGKGSKVRAGKERYLSGGKRSRKREQRLGRERKRGRAGKGRHMSREGR